MPRARIIRVQDSDGRGPWDANPWVAAITFRPVFANIDSTEAATVTPDH